MGIVQGRLHLMGEGHGLVFDIPYEEVEQVYGAAEGTSLHAAYGGDPACLKDGQDDDTFLLRIVTPASGEVFPKGCVNKASLQFLDRAHADVEGIAQGASLGPGERQAGEVGRTSKCTLSGVASPLSVKRRPSVKMAVACATAKASVTVMNVASSSCNPRSCAMASKPA